MSEQHRHQFVREAFAEAELQIGKVHDIGMGVFVYARRESSGHVEGEVCSYTDHDEATINRADDLFTRAARHVKQVANFKDPHPFANYKSEWKGSRDYWFIAKDSGKTPEAIMDSWISQHGEGNVAVNLLCTKRAQQDLKQIAQQSRPSDLASPEEAMALRRSRGRAM